LLYESLESLTRDEKFGVMFWKKFYQKVMLLFIVILVRGGGYFRKFGIGVCHEGSFPTLFKDEGHEGKIKN